MAVQPVQAIEDMNCVLILVVNNMIMSLECIVPCINVRMGNRFNLVY